MKFFLPKKNFRGTNIMVELIFRHSPLVQSKTIETDVKSIFSTHIYMTTHFPGSDWLNYLYNNVVLAMSMPI